MAKQSTGQRTTRLRSLIKKGKPRPQKPKHKNKWKRVSKSGSGRRVR